jgi:cytochrome c553
MYSWTLTVQQKLTSKAYNKHRYQASGEHILDRNKNLAAVWTVALCVATAAYAGDSPSEINQRIGSGDPIAGRDKSALCQGCHGEDGNSVAPTFPKLSGQWSDYIQKQVREFQNGARFNETMTDVAASVDNFQDLFDIAAYFASQKQMEGTPIEDPEEEKLYLEGQKLFTQGNERTGAFRCVKCHGEFGKGQPLNNNLFPVIGGQHKDYLVKQLTDFKTEERENDRSGMMLRITTRLTDHDINALATYLSRDPPAALPVESAAVSAPAPALAIISAPVAVSDSYQILMEDKPVRIEGTNFDLGSTKLKKTAYSQLNGVVEFAVKQPDAKLEIIGYTDTSGLEKTNIKLSIARAEAVKKYLVKKGIPANRILVKGQGSANPLGDNKTKEGRALNRRVEIRSVIQQLRKVLIRR